jgi:tetratricopeptide (TPR) repeat protein
MSLFKDSFHESIKIQLDKRQTAINTRTPQNLQYYNSRNAWIRLSSSVNVDTGGGNYTSDLAKQYVLQGGVLKDYNKGQGTLRSGLTKLYSDGGAYNTSGVFEPYRLGIRPMPGITGVDIKSKGAYGSIRYATVNFQCWDIKQLEDLELLYMRPGYTVLLEWGWTPYLDNNGNYQPTFTDYTDIIDTDWKKEDLFELQYKKSTETHQGNYDAMFGYVKNYSWKARMDGGYDCSTEIISMGEVVESLKVNYAPLDNIKSIKSTGLLMPNVSKTDGSAFSPSNTDLSSSYSQNILAGLFSEIHGIGLQTDGDVDEGIPYVLQDKVYKNYYDLFRVRININSKDGSKDATSKGDVGNTDQQVYITLETLTHILNNYVLLRDQKANKPFTSISVLEKNASNPDPLTGNGYLLDLTHPVQISTDVSVCLIKSPLWLNGGLKLNNGGGNGNSGSPPAVKPVGDPNDLTKAYSNTKYFDVFNKMVEENADVFNADTDEDVIIQLIQSKTKGGNTDELREFQRQYLLIKESVVDKGLNTVPGAAYGVNQRFVNWIKRDKFSSAYSLLNSFLNNQEINKILTGKEYNTTVEDIDKYNYGKNAITLKPNDSKTKELQAELDKKQRELQKAIDDQQKSLKNIEYLNNLVRPYFVPPGAVGQTGPAWSSGLGIIGNIYLNVTMLYNLCVNDSLASQDKKEKNDISLYDFMKNVLAKVSTAIGNINNFDLFVDTDNVCRIIDINYVDRQKASDAYTNAFELQVQNTNSVVRSYGLESKIFPEQSTIVAIGAQVGGGALGIDTTTLVAFNRSIVDRIIPIKDAPTSPATQNTTAVKFENLIDALNTLTQFWTDLSYYNFLGIQFADRDFDLDEAGRYANALKDLINFFKAYGKDNSKNKAILPTTLNVEMDGIGGIIIGNIFRLPEDVLPKGYKGKGYKGKGYKGGDIGSKLGYTVTGIGHSLQNNDWVTKLEAQTIILDEPEGEDFDYSNITITLAVENEQVVITGGGTPPKGNTNIGGTTKVFNGKTYQNGKVDELLISIRQDIYNRHYSSVNQSDGKRIRLQAAAMQNLEKLLTDAYTAGVYVKVNSAYRTYDDQVRIQQASTKSGLPAATPGRSNHGFGLAVDLGDVNGVRINPIKTPKEWKWIQANKYKYSFENINDGNESHHYNFYG